MRTLQEKADEITPTRTAARNSINGSGGSRKGKKRTSTATLTATKKQSILEEFLKSAEGRNKLAASIAAPLRLRMDYSSVAQKAFKIMKVCIVCKKPGFELRLYDDFFSNFFDPNSGYIGGEPLHVVCMNCARETAFRLKALEEMPLDMMPLFINDNNFFIAKRAGRRLEEGK